MVGGTVHQRHGGVDCQVFCRLASGSLRAATLTFWWLHATGASQVKGGFLLHALGAVLLLTAVAMLFRKRIHAFGRSLRADARPVQACSAGPHGARRGDPGFSSH